MKKLVLTLVLFLIAEFITDLKAQNSNYIYNSNGDKFYFIINKSKKYFQFKNNIAIEKKKEKI